ncbi:hypothetical protein CRG98_037952, partial [Punica granatum]
MAEEARVGGFNYWLISVPTLSRPILRHQIVPAAFPSLFCSLSLAPFSFFLIFTFPCNSLSLVAEEVQ